MKSSRYPLTTKIILLIALAAALIGLIRLVNQPSEELNPEPIRKTRHLMGTLWEIQVIPERDSTQEQINQAIVSAFNEIDRIEQLMSEWIPESPISAINRAAGKGAVDSPGELVSIIRRGIEYGNLSQGVFDITWRGLADLWRFDDTFVPPSEAEISKALKHVDYRKIRIEDSRVALPEGFVIGLGGIAKGYAVDRAGSVLKKAGYKNFLVNGGGDILTSGRRNTRAWTIGVQSPRGGRNELVARVNASDRAVVTSGDYERYRIYQGIRYHHILDPRTGKPARGTQSATIVARTAEEADVLATTIFILGHEAGLRLISRRERTEAFIIDADGKFWYTKGFQEITEFF